MPHSKKEKMMTRAALIFVLFAAYGPSTMAWDEKAFKKAPPEELKKILKPSQYKVACEGSTEPPFNNPYWDHHEPGIYVDVVSGEPLFSSIDKFDSGTGWPSFTQPIESKNVTTHEDKSLGMSRTEVRSKHGDSHLGHVFDDGPGPTKKRFCINSASLRFVHAENLTAEGYEEYASLFPKIKQKPKAPKGTPQK